jgi:hypothetical protein
MSRPDAKRPTMDSMDVPRGDGRLARRFAGGPALDLAPLEFLRAFRARQRLSRPDRRAPDALMILEGGIRALGRQQRSSAPARESEGVDTFLAFDAKRNNSRILDARFERVVRARHPQGTRSVPAA